MQRPEMDTYDAWCDWRQARARRRSTIETFANVVASQVVLIALFVQFYRGHLSSLPFSNLGEKVVVGVVVCEVVALLVNPQVTAAVAGRVLRAVGSSVISVATAVALGVLYLAAWPLAVTVGRRGLIRRHPATAPWVGSASVWRVSAWTPKITEADRVGPSGTKTLWRLLGYFMAQRTYFLLIVTVVVLVMVSLSVFAQTSQLAPFVYTLF
jgi:hypothetical protein